MIKVTVVTPLYLSVAWTLMISYQLFTQTAVETIIEHIATLYPWAGAWFASRTDMIVFIYAFSWVFVLSSVIPSIILGKERSVIVQFLVTLILTLIAFLIQDALIATISGLASLFLNTGTAIVYLVIPYLLMLIFDVYSKIRLKKRRR